MMCNLNNGRFILWLMGPTSSGKTTIAECFFKKMIQRDVPIIHFDGDEVRGFFGADFGFTQEKRLMVVKTIVHLTVKSFKAGLNVVVSALTANSDARAYIHKNISNITIGYVNCPIEICAERDPKGLYQLAKKGKVNTLIGYNRQYKAPENPDIILNSSKNSPNMSADILEKYFY